MRFIKMFGLAAVAAVAAMAFVGAGSASAATSGCKVNEATCTAGNTYAVGTAFKAEGNPVLTGGGATVECHSVMEGTFVENPGATQAKAEITTAKWENCTPTGCEVTSVQLPWIAHIEKTTVPNGTIWVGPKPGHETKAEAPGALLNSGCTGFVNCTFKVKEQQPGYSAEQWISGTIFGGAPATIELNRELRSNCFVTGNWNAAGTHKYTVVSPNPLYITG